MSKFITGDFLLTTEPARKLYHEYAAKMPVFDYHCHLSPREIYENKRFESIGEAWLAGGMAPADYENIGAMIQDICFNNVWAYIGMDD